MASTGAVLYIRPMFTASSSAGRVSTAHLSVSLRLVSGLWTSTGVVPEFNYTNLRAWLPTPGQPVVDAVGRMTPPWYRFFAYVAETRLGGITGPSVPDVAAGVATAITTSTAESGRIGALAAQSQTNAEALSVVVQVAQNNGLVGADQIPPVSRNYYEIQP